MRNLANAFTAALLLAGAVFAANIHFVAGPDFICQGTQLTACGSLAGLGNQDIVITLEASGTATLTCTNPGGNKPPGQNKIPIRSIGGVTIPRGEIKNGRVDFCVTTPPVETPDCQGEGQIASLSAVGFTSATITVKQGSQTKVFNQAIAVSCP